MQKLNGFLTKSNIVPGNSPDQYYLVDGTKVVNMNTILDCLKSKFITITVDDGIIIMETKKGGKGENEKIALNNK